MPHYIGILDGSGDVWGVRIPDLPGCNGGGSTPEAAISDAVSAAREWAEHQRGKGNALPTPRPIVDVMKEAEPGEAAVIVPLLLDAGRTVRVNMTFDAGLLELIDEEASARGLTRSAFLASAARQKIANAS